ncbi:MAG: hypothetical protein ABJF23_01150 [Bryobacteraceae bacterium]
MLRFAVLFLSAVLAFAAEEVVFSGTPSVRIDADGKQSVRVELSDLGAKKYECRIVSKGKKFLWASRGNRELIRSDSGDYTYFVSPEGTGYIKVALVKTGDAFGYMESFTTDLKTVTYWGNRTKVP